MKRTLLFEKEKETKRTVRYKEVPESQAGPIIIGTLYVKKEFARDAQSVKVLVETLFNE